MNGSAALAFFSFSGTSACQPVRSLPLNKLVGFAPAADAAGGTVFDAWASA
jgi:hypothetical protein